MILAGIAHKPLLITNEITNQGETNESITTISAVVGHFVTNRLL